MFNPPPIRKVFEGGTRRHKIYALFNRQSQSPFDDDRMNGTRYVGERFEILDADHDHMFEILAPLFYRGDMFAMRAFLAASLTRVLFNLKIDDRTRWCTAIAISATRNPPIACAGIIARQPRPVRVMARLEKRYHIWSVTRADFRMYNDLETSS